MLFVRIERDSLICFYDNTENAKISLWKTMWNYEQSIILM